MRFGRALPVVLGLALASGLFDCGGRPPGSADADVDGALVPAPGVCHKLCCSASDCAPGDTCQPIDPASGTLGVCSSTRPGPDSGTPTLDASPWPEASTTGDASAGDANAGDARAGDATGTPPDASIDVSVTPGDASASGGDAGEAGDAGLSDDAGSLLPASCWSASDPVCDPLDNSPCDTLGEVCDLGDNTDGSHDLFCFSGPSTVAPGGACDNVLGPWCLPGYHCVTAGGGG